MEGMVGFASKAVQLGLGILIATLLILMVVKAAMGISGFIRSRRRSSASAPSRSVSASVEVDRTVEDFLGSVRRLGELSGDRRVLGSYHELSRLAPVAPDRVGQDFLDEAASLEAYLPSQPVFVRADLVVLVRRFRRHLAAVRAAR